MSTISNIWRAARAQVAASQRRFNSVGGSNWLARALAVLVAIVLAVPILALVLIVALIAAAVVLVGSGIAALVGLVRPWLPRRDGRENVRVIVRRDA